MKKFVVIPFSRYMADMAAERGDGVCQTNTDTNQATMAEITNPTSATDYSRAINKMTDNRPILMTDQGGGNMAPKPPSKETLKKFAGDRKMKAVGKRRARKSASMRQKHFTKKTNWLKF